MKDELLKLLNDDSDVQKAVRQISAGPELSKEEVVNHLAELLGSFGEDALDKSPVET